MKTLRQNILFLAAAVLLAACKMKGDVKPLVGGIRTEAQSTQSNPESSASNPSKTSKISKISKISKASKNPKTSSSPKTPENLEIPAPLSNISEQILKRTGYTTSYNKDTRLPNWVAWNLTAAHTEGPAKRPQRAFHEDEDVPTPRATDNDYYNKGYDRGHLCPAADNKWSEEAMMESFLFTNICPQNHGLNIGDWNELENQCRAWAKKYGSIYIVSGPILYKGRHKTIGKNKVVVPEAFFKVVLRMEPEPAAIGFVYKNVSGNRPKGDYMNSVDEIERITGMDFFPSLPDDVENRIEAVADLEEW